MDKEVEKPPASQERFILVGVAYKMAQLYPKLTGSQVVQLMQVVLQHTSLLPRLEALMSLNTKWHFHFGHGADKVLSNLTTCLDDLYATVEEAKYGVEIRQIQWSMDYYIPTP